MVTMPLSKSDILSFDAYNKQLKILDTNIQYFNVKKGMLKSGLQRNPGCIEMKKGYHKNVVILTSI